MAFEISLFVLEQRITALNIKWVLRNDAGESVQSLHRFSSQRRADIANDSTLGYWKDSKFGFTSPGQESPPAKARTVLGTVSISVC